MVDFGVKRELDAFYQVEGYCVLEAAVEQRVSAKESEHRW